MLLLIEKWSSAAARAIPKPDLDEVSILLNGVFSEQSIHSAVLNPQQTCGLQGQKLFATSDYQSVCHSSPFYTASPHCLTVVVRQFSADCDSHGAKHLRHTAV